MRYEVAYLRLGFAHNRHKNYRQRLTLILLFTTTPTFANGVDPDQMASEEAI